MDPDSCFYTMNFLNATVKEQRIRGLIFKLKTRHCVFEVAKIYIC